LRGEAKADEEMAREARRGQMDRARRESMRWQTQWDEMQVIDRGEKRITFGRGKQKTRAEDKSRGQTRAECQPEGKDRGEYKR
jgi:hypothetical protein